MYAWSVATWASTDDVPKSRFHIGQFLRCAACRKLREEVVLENCHTLEEVVDLRSGLKDVTASRGARIGEEGEDGVQVLRVPCVKA